MPNPLPSPYSLIPSLSVPAYIFLSIFPPTSLTVSAAILQFHNMAFPTPLSILILIIATCLPFTLSSPQLPPPNDGYGDTPPPPASIPYFPGGIIMPTFSFPFMGGNPFTTSKKTTAGLPKTTAGLPPGYTFNPPPPPTSTTSSADGLPGYTFNPPPPPPSSNLPGLSRTPSVSPFPPPTTTPTIQTSNTVDGITGPSISNPTSLNIPPATSCLAPSLSLSVVTQIRTSTLTTHLVSVSYTTIIQPIQVTVPSVIVESLTLLQTLTNHYCPPPTTTLGGGGSNGNGGGGSSTCVWAPPITTGGYTIPFQPVVGGIGVGVSPSFESSYKISTTNFFYAETEVPYAEFKCQFQCGAGCSSYFVGFCTSHPLPSPLSLLLFPLLL
ncbi:uncharacterized protein LY89DRAFT_431677 [Mollisia scopiformis]|uniref:Uncharacterized protein n=1 Tax=Mollisia scopiformis TaxID=149040 RepID=A0A194XM64_MOLSC|nr:uncharacterized protein LY89DRAFT_431677 [Mollisia scopiformis]KUJ21335.1 hypothetical protein LY89DRAFT_431677 [Mollisia scopiformis]